MMAAAIKYGSRSNPTGRPLPLMRSNHSARLADLVLALRFAILLRTVVQRLQR